MYRTCLYCKHDLGFNQELETLPVGGRVAFDVTRGRLWVVCSQCRRWCLTPLEDRWEAIEDCERLYRATRLRLGTEQVGLAHLPSGLELIRVGRPLRPELAAWRFAGRIPGLVRRTGHWIHRQMTRTIIGPSKILHQVPRALLAIRFIRRDDVRRILWRPPHDSEPWGIERELIAADPDLPHGGTSLHAEFAPGQRFVGDERLRVGGLALTELNRGGWAGRRVRDALEWLDTFGNPFTVGMEVDEKTAFLAGARFGPAGSSALRYPVLLTDLSPAVRLALEMASHEAEERLFLQGELWRLERAWKEAEEVAAIADQLTVPDWVAGWVEERRAVSTPPPGPASRVRS